MIKTLAVAGSLLGLATIIPSDNPPPFPSIDTKCKLLWKSKIGKTSFRNNVVIQGDKLWIGSNGESFMDYGFIEPSSGVYALDRRTGKKLKHFSNELFGDMDVAGLLIFNNRIFFGNDNEEFLCTDANGKILWRNPTSGDIEHEPVLIQTKTGASIVYAAESGEVKAVDPETGNARWSYYRAGFEGWRPGDNRAVFKVKAWFSNGSGFFTKPLILDLNLDGTNDLVYRTYSGELIALDGSSGKELWTVKDKGGLDMTMGVVGTRSEKKIVGLNTYYEDSSTVMHNAFTVYDRFGRRIQSISISGETYGNGLNALEIDSENLLLNGLTKTFLVNAKGIKKEIDRAIFYKGTDWTNNVVELSRNGRDPLIGDRVISLTNGKRGVVVMNQYDRANYDFAFLEILSLEDGTVIDRISLPTGSEMPPVIRDVNMDGKLDILIGGYDGYLYCYQLPKF